MDIRQPCNIFSLFIESFKLINRSCGALIVFLLSAVISLVAIYAALWWLHASIYIVVIVSIVYPIFLNVACIRLIGSKAESDGTSLSDLFAASALPTVFMIILHLIYALVALIGMLLFQRVIFSVVHPSFPMFISLLVVGFILGIFLFIKLGFAPLAIALRGQGPLRAIMYSWQVTRGYFFHILAAIFLITVFSLLFLTVTRYGLYKLLPFPLHSHFDIIQLSWSWRLGLILLGIVTAGVHLSLFAYWILIFLNLDYNERNADEFRATVPATGDEAEDTLLSPTGEGLDVVRGEKIEQQIPVQVLKASVVPQTNDESLAQHLTEVYQPQQEEVANPTEEDRLPTILFDDEFAKQMEQRRAQWEQEKKKANGKKPEDDDHTPIKMSK